MCKIDFWWLLITNSSSSIYFQLSLHLFLILTKSKWWRFSFLNIYIKKYNFLSCDEFLLILASSDVWCCHVAFTFSLNFINLGIWFKLKRILLWFHWYTFIFFSLFVLNEVCFKCFRTKFENLPPSLILLLINLTTVGLLRCWWSPTSNWMETEVQTLSYWRLSLAMELNWQSSSSLPFLLSISFN